MSNFRAAIRNSWEKNWPEIVAACTGSASHFVYARNPKSLDHTVPVFCYHELDQDRFEEDLDFLARNDYKTIDAQALVEHVNGIRTAPSRSVVLTVDDGARSLVDVGLPLLKKYSMNAVAFIIPRFHRDLSGEDARMSQRLCTWSELKTLHESGMVDIQSHSYEHRYIPRWPELIPVTGEDPAVIDGLLGPAMSVENDFRSAAETIERKIGKVVKHLAFVKFVGSEEAVTTGLACGYQSFWWGYLPRHRGNKPDQDPTRITRFDSIYVQRLPGSGRKPLREILAKRFGSRLSINF